MIKTSIPSLLVAWLLLPPMTGAHAADAPRPNPNIIAGDWDPVLAANRVIARLINVTAPQVKGTHDAEFVCVGDRAYIVAQANDVQPGESAEWPFQYVTMTVVNLNSLRVENVTDFAKGGQVFENGTLPAGACVAARIIQKDASKLRCYFDSNDPGERQSQVWYRDFELKRGDFAPTLHKAKLKTAAGTFDFQPQYLHADAAAKGFMGKASDSTAHIFDSFKRFDGKIYVALNNFKGRQNALALLHDDLETFEVIGHFNEPESAALSESSVNRLPNGTWMAICRQEGGNRNYLFSTSPDGRTWSTAAEMPHVPGGTSSKPTFDKFGDTYYLGWQVRGAGRSIFHVDVSNDGRTWERKYRFETPESSFQYPALHEHKGAIWLCVTQGRKERIMFGKLEEIGGSNSPNP
jgi:hypothetical protein